MINRLENRLAHDQGSNYSIRIYDVVDSLNDVLKELVSIYKYRMDYLKSQVDFDATGDIANDAKRSYDRRINEIETDLWEFWLLKNAIFELLSAYGNVDEWISIHAGGGPYPQLKKGNHMAADVYRSVIRMQDGEFPKGQPKWIDTEEE